MTDNLHPTGPQLLVNFDVIAAVLDDMRQLADWLARHAPSVPGVKIVKDHGAALTLYPTTSGEMNNCLLWVSSDDGAAEMTVARELLDVVLNGPGFAWIAGSWWVQHDVYTCVVARDFGQQSIRVVIPTEAIR